MRQGSGACTAPYLPRAKFEEAVLTKLKTHVLARENPEQLVNMVAEEMDAASTQWREHLEAIERELAEGGKRLERLYDALESGKFALDDLAPRIQELRQRQDRLQIARDGIDEHMRERKKELVDFEIIKAYAEDLQAVLSEGSLTERKTFIKSFVKEVVVASDEAVIRYTMPLPPSQVEEEPVLCIVHDGGPG
jgi:DNA repair exonuclease SbcCD ATPase subunit